MLYDPKWEKRSGELTAANLIAWLEMQPPETRYDYCDAKTCLVAAFLKSHGIEEFRIDRLPPEIDVIANAPFGTEWTYGAALERARRRSLPSTHTTTGE